MESRKLHVIVQFHCCFGITKGRQFRALFHGEHRLIVDASWLIYQHIQCLFAYGDIFSLVQTCLYKFRKIRKKKRKKKIAIKWYKRKVNWVNCVNVTDINRKKNQQSMRSSFSSRLTFFSHLLIICFYSLSFVSFFSFFLLFSLLVPNDWFREWNQINWVGKQVNN